MISTKDYIVYQQEDDLYVRLRGDKKASFLVTKEDFQAFLKTKDRTPKKK